MLRRGLLTFIAVLGCTTLPAAAQAAPTWLPPGSIPSANFPWVAMNGDGLTAIGFTTPGTNMADAVIHAPGDSAFSSPLPASTAGSVSWLDTDVNARGDVAVGWDDGSEAWAAIKPAGGAFGAPIALGHATSGFGYNVQIALADNGDLAAAWEDYDGVTVKHWILKPAGGPLGTLGTVYTTNVTYGGPRIAMDAAGDAVVTWTQYNGSHWVVNEVSRPAGGSFGAPVTLSDTSQDAITPYVAVGGSGGAAVVWTGFSGSSYAVRLSRRTSAAGEFGLPIKLSPTATSASYPMVAANTAGDLVATWGLGGDVQARVGSLTDAFDPVVDFEAYDSPPQAAISDSGEAVVTWGVSQVVRASVRAPGGGFRTPVDVSTAPALVYGNVPAAPVDVDAGGDIVAAWIASGTSEARYRVYDVAGPRLGALSVPGTATAGTAASFSVAPLDAFSTIASTHWDFGDGAGADGASVSHTFGAAGTYTVKVTATDAVGNATSDTRSIAVAAAPPAQTTTTPQPPPPPVTPKVTCKVPNLKGLTLTKAKKKLTAAHCKLGKVTTPKTLRKVKGLVVVKQTPKSGTVKPSGFKVTVTLGKKPKSKH